METNELKLSMTKADSFYLAWWVDGVTSLDEATFKVYGNPNDEDSLIVEKDMDDGISEVDTGKYRVRLAPEDTADVEAGRYYYKLRTVVNNDASTILKGAFLIEP